MTTWGNYKLQIRRTILRDTTPDDQGNFSFTDDVLLDALGWSLTTFAQHTAIATATSYSPATGQDYALPDNVMDSDRFDQVSQVFFAKPDGTPKRYLDPIWYTPDAFYEGYGYYSYPEYNLHLTNKPHDCSDDDILYVRYFAYYNVPSQDSDVLQIPRWAEVAVSYLVAARVLSGNVFKTADIRQWGAKPDTGNPDNNPILKVQQQFLKLYEDEIARYAPQDRVSHWRTRGPVNS